MSLAGLIHRHVLLPAFETGVKRRPVMRLWRELECSQWFGWERLRGMQFEALGALIRHAFDSCPYYRDSWTRMGLWPGELKTLEDLARWPLIEREAVREHRTRMRSTRRMRLLTKATGGSRGAPLTFDLDEGSNDRRMAAWHRGYGWAGAAPGTSQLHLWGVPTGERTWKKRLKDGLYHRMYRRRIVSCFGMGEGFAGAFVRALERERPDAIVAYTNPLYEVACRLEEAGERPGWRPRAVVVGAEKLHDFQRERIERVFGAPVFETYGSREFMLIGAECERHEGLHVTAEHLIVEVVDDHGRPVPAGVEGNVVITDLYNYGMPFVRYANGDRAVAAAGLCGCGRGLPMLARVSGRVLEMIRTPDGRVLAGEFFPHLMKDFGAVRRFQVIQEEPALVRVLLVAPALGDDDRGRLEGCIGEALGPAVRVELECVEDIPLTGSGKHRVVVNRVAVRRAA